jgi:hypothetical protein
MTDKPVPLIRKAYLADSVYAVYDGEHVILAASNGLSDTQFIYLNEEALLELLQFIDGIIAERAPPKDDIYT